MPNYLLAVNHDEADQAMLAALTPEQMQGMFEAVGAFNEKLQAEGAWVFAGGLQTHDATTVVDNTGDAPSSPTAPTPSRRSTSAGSGSSRPPTSTPRSPGPPRARRRAATGSRSGRSRTSPRPDAVGAARWTGSSGSSARSTAGWSPRWRAASVTSTSPRTPPARRSWSPSSGGRSTGSRPTRAAWLTTTAGAPRDRPDPPRARRDAKHQAALDDRATTPRTSRPAWWRTTGSGWSSPAATRRSRPRPGWRSRCACSAGSPCAEIAHAFFVPETTMAQRITRAKKKIAAARIPYRVPGGGRPARAGRRRAGRGLPRLQRGLPVDVAGTRSATTSPPRRSGSAGSCAGCCPTSPRSPGSSR